MLAILALLVEQIDEMALTSVAQPAMIVIVVASGPILFCQEQLVKSHVGVGWGEVHFSHGFSAIAGIAQ